MTAQEPRPQQPPKGKKRGADTTLNIRISTEFKEMIATVAQSYGVSASELIRALALAEVRDWEAKNKKAG